ncbi:membrane protein implicated in regulation of membrane protease activity [Pseudonocardia sediminis]|uniref:Membrane protein implicated in regulation of membrane protease activity n=1 Tax=Pseudonocardia sediminis TaxID=1397368 RepID=A0A4Q7UWH7_PSEST|nr:NfeD family protein [Pseudonocardia sediminis]RZT86312.1 membrane protein implicated in regulation of membrane protease activity [Pseudonocardia sediminis]
MTPALIWLLAGVVLIGAEAVSGELFLLMLGGGAIAAAGGVALGLGFFGAAVVFAVVSVALLLAVRPIVRRRLESSMTPLETHHGTMVGRDAEVVHRVDGETGRVKIAGELWSARSKDGHEVIEEGSIATVLEVSGAIALVTGRGELPGPDDRDLAS